MTVQNEPLSWELVDFWRKHGEEHLCAVDELPIVVARDAGGRIRGFAALRSSQTGVPDRAIVEPVVATTLHTALAVMDEMEKLLREAGYLGYIFYTTDQSPAGFAEQVRRCGVFRELSTSRDVCWFTRDLVKV